MRKAGLYSFGHCKHPALAPQPLVVEEAELDEMLAALDGAIGELETAYARSLK